MNNTLSPVTLDVISAIGILNKKHFSVREIAEILIGVHERFTDIRKAKSFAYNQLQKLVALEFLYRKKKPGANESIYLKATSYRNIGINDYDISQLANNKGSMFNAKKLEVFKAKYELELLQIMGEKDVFAELLTEIPEFNKELGLLIDEMNKQASRVTGKISAINKIIKRVVF